MNKKPCTLARIEQARDNAIWDFVIFRSNRQTMEPNWLSSAFWLVIPIGFSSKEKL
jgi:hypothetical protein